MGQSLKYRSYRRSRMSTHTVTEVRAEGNYTLWLRFDDGLEGHVYLADLVETEMFGTLSDQEKFSRAAVDPVMNVVTWEGDISLDPDALYHDVVSRSHAPLH